VLLSARADVQEWDDDDRERYRISVDVTNPVFVQVFEYDGSFDVEWVDCEDVPLAVRPKSATRGE
jgi:hypothetical protein